ncbi:MAG: hypothetical protein KME07_01760 [Pegethrix bostrychoides GSE-TBD4-15B]|uniref:Uncharacterized protein n=1 Tax=Pegethrix bostrychoides GSE-TBD4-15B TaxID=2839662 RepID=A0A951P6N9_9CYAN|nr:hypothetical protein [Pegethrix bostrychoides GSE-TBD4-15B]
MPKFADIRAWEQAELLMQPVFIRVLDNIRKQLEQTTWQSSYQEIPVWLEAVPEETQTQVMELQQRLASASAAEAEAIEEELARLPSPQMSYLLCLKKGDRQITVDIWQLCYQVCFRNYSPVLNAMDQDMIVTVDVSLIDDLGEIDWLRLDEKAKYLIEQIFSSLSPAQPTAEAPADHTEPADGE